MNTVKDHVKGKSEFQFYRKGELYYKTNDTGFEFRVPCNNDDAVLNKEEKSITLMKYISKELKMKNEALAEIECDKGWIHGNGQPIEKNQYPELAKVFDSSK